MHVGILACTNMFNAFLRQVNDLSDPREVFIALSKFVMQLRDAAVDRTDSANWLLGVMEGQRGGWRFLGPVGGFYNTDVDLLLEIIWEDRAGFLRICSQAPTPGWALPFLLITQHLEWALQKGLYVG